MPPEATAPNANSSSLLLIKDEPGIPGVHNRNPSRYRPHLSRSNRCNNRCPKVQDNDNFGARTCQSAAILNLEIESIGVTLPHG
jgi:hypothetical protein